MPMPPQKVLNRRHELIAGVVNEWFQTLPYPQNQTPRHTLIADLNGVVQRVVDAASAVAKEDRAGGGVHAEDLPDESVVAGARVVYIKNHPTDHTPWRGTNGGYFGDWAVDEELAAGAQVLRVGDGKETEG